VRSFFAPPPEWLIGREMRRKSHFRTGSRRAFFISLLNEKFGNDGTQSACEDLWSDRRDLVLHYDTQDEPVCEISCGHRFFPIADLICISAGTGFYRICPELYLCRLVCRSFLGLIAASCVRCRKGPLMTRAMGRRPRDRLGGNYILH